MSFNEEDIAKIVYQIVSNLKNQTEEASKLTGKIEAKSTFLNILQKGVFENIHDAINAAQIAYERYRSFSLADREKFINAIRNTCLDNIELLAKEIYDETKLGNYQFKLAKLKLTIEKTPGIEILKTEAMSGDMGLMIEERAPFGVIGAITPITNPVETIINNAISMLASGNTVVFNPHPSSKKCAALAIQLINEAIVKVDGPENLVTMVKSPTKDTVEVLAQDSRILLLVGTGGSEMVKSLLKSGKKVIGAGAGNPPVIVDETADIPLAAKKIIEGASFDNNILCISEKEVFVVESVADDLIYHMLKEGAYLLNKEEVKKIKELVLYEDINHNTAQCSSAISNIKYHTKKEWIGKNASEMLENIGLKNMDNTPLIIFETVFDCPFVQLEQMMPILPIVRVKNVDEAIKLALKAEHGNRHTASMFSKNVYNLTKFAKQIETTIFVKNSSTLAGVGYGGEGCTSMTLAGPTGEGITNALTFTRIRRCVLGEGGFRIV